MNKGRPHVLGFHPSSRGFGWVVFEDQLSLLDWGVVDVRANQNAAAINRMNALMDKHRPATLVLERFKDRRGQRIRELCFAVVMSARKKGVSIYHCSRTQISRSRTMRGARTRQEVAVAVAGHLTVLRPRLPKPQQIWVGERSAMRLFCAAACALAYFDNVQPP